MTIEKALNMLAALDEIRGQKIAKEKALAIFRLRKILLEQSEFFKEQRDEAIKRLGLTVDDGEIRFGNDEEKARQYIKEISEIGKTEVEIDSEPIDLSNEDMKISAAFLEATDGMIIL